MHKLLLYYHTLKHLKPVQIYGRLWFRLYRPRPDNRPDPGLREIEKELVEPCRRVCSMTASMKFCFIGETGGVENAEDWSSPWRTKLWLYNLHYFDDLNAENAEGRQKWHIEYLRRWIAENPPGKGVGWEPYPTSLRMVNWIKWAVGGNSPAGGMADSLAVQARWLEQRLEYHLLGNHLLANAKALAAAGLFFQGDEARRWYKTGMNLLEGQLREQVLEDGGHFERSPMYHLIVLEDLLDLMNLHRVYGKDLPAGWVALAEKMLCWSTAMRHPDGEIPFFNDAAFGIAPGPGEVDGYGARLGVGRSQGGQDRIVHMEQSGYVRLERGPAVLLADAGPVGPDYLPGHAHADSLCFELSLQGQRVCVNSGTSTYEPGSLRKFQRSTRAHNTAALDGADSSEVWGAFRVARRARTVVETLRTGGDEDSLSAVHDGYCRLPGRPVHRRTWRLKSGGLRVDDEISGKGVHLVEIFLHFHPVITAAAKGDDIELLDRKTGIFLARIRWDEGMEAHLEDGFWHPEFSKSEANKCCVFRLEAVELPVKAGFEIEWTPGGQKHK
ncbi:MAG: heparinase II/III family protein [Desulfobacteraceae bacterium]|nr:heparinase II/III family protein [Desulfobacteraceae bacterium]